MAKSAKTPEKAVSKEPAFNVDELKTEVRSILKELDDKKLLSVAKSQGVDVKKYADLPRSNMRMNVINCCVGAVGRSVKEGKSKRSIIEAFRA